MGTADRLRTDDVAGGGTPAPLVAGQSRTRHAGANYGTADVRYNPLLTYTLTPQGAGAADTFEVGFYSLGADGEFARTDTSAIAYNADAATLQTAVRTASGDTGMTVSGGGDGTTPWVITPTLALVADPVVTALTAGFSMQVSRSTIAYGDPDTTLDNGINFDQESSDGIGEDVPLGYSIITDGTGQSDGTVLAPPTVDGAAGGSAQVVITATEVASGGTSAVVLYAVKAVDTDFATWATVDSEDADGDVTISSLAAGDYVLLAHTQTANGRVSRPADPVYFAVS
jgi:hypothetical protein